MKVFCFRTRAPYSRSPRLRCCLSVMPARSIINPASAHHRRLSARRRHDIWRASSAIG